MFRALASGHGYQAAQNYTCFVREACKFQLQGARTQRQHKITSPNKSCNTRDNAKKTSSYEEK